LVGERLVVIHRAGRRCRLVARVEGAAADEPKPIALK